MSCGKPLTHYLVARQGSRYHFDNHRQETAPGRAILRPHGSLFPDPFSLSHDPWPVISDL
jgi:hypothetical protein